MKIKQLKEKTAQGLKDFLPKIGVNDIEGLIDVLNDKLSKSQGGEINKPIVITSKNSEYSLTINPDVSVYIWSKKSQRNIFSIIPFVSSTIISGNDISISNINSLSSIYQGNQNIYYGYTDSFTASKFKLRNGTNNQVLLGDGSTTSKLVSYISTSPQSDGYIVNILNIDNSHDSFTIPGATKKLAGLMTAADKTKLDGIENTYISSQDGNIYSNYDANNGSTTLSVTGNYDEEDSGGRIALKRTEDGKGKLSIMLDGSEGSVNAETFKAIANPNENEVWCTDGSRLNVLNLLSNAAIYVAGRFELVGITNSTTVIDNPDSIIFSRSGRFFAKKDSVYYTHWNADISKNIAPPSRYGIETNTGVFPFNNQMYKFSESNSLYTATCSNGSCTMTKLTINKE